MIVKLGTRARILRDQAKVDVIALDDGSARGREMGGEFFLAKFLKTVKRHLSPSSVKKRRYIPTPPEIGG
jgi:hypothetical protein